MADVSARSAAGELRLPVEVTEALKASLPAVGERTVRAIIVEVPSYANALAGEMGHNIRTAVELALGGFLSLVSRPRGSDQGTPLAPALDGAYALGRGEARSGRSMDALLAAYRVGARVAWRELSAEAVAARVDPQTLAQFAELVFAYIDQLSASSVAGHADELATSGRVRERYLQGLGRRLLDGAGVEELAEAAQRADWEPPQTLTAVVLPAAQLRGVQGSLPEQSLRCEEDLPDLAGDDEADLAVLLVPDAHDAARPALVRGLRSAAATVGPARPWTSARASYLRALRVRRLAERRDGPVDTDDHLARLVLTADPGAIADLRARSLAPLAGFRPSTVERLAETLRAWLLLQGRRDEVAAALHVHPQTVRYRMGQIRQAYGDRLSDPDEVLNLLLALA